MRVNRNIIYTSLAIVVLMGLVSVAIIPGFAARHRGSVQQVAKDFQPMQATKETEKATLTVQDPRPVAKALEELEAKYGWVITYEDPLYVHPSETSDVTAQVRKDLAKFRPGEAPRVLIPAGGSLAITYDVSADTKVPVDRDAVVRKVLDANQTPGGVSRFRLEREKGSEMLHAIPTVTKTAAGVFAQHTAVLDAVISISQGDRSSLQTLQAICEAVSQATGTQVVLGTVPIGPFMNHRDSEVVVSQKARDVLVQTLTRVGGSTNLSWQLLFDPGLKTYYLNIHVVPAVKAATNE